MVLTFNGLAELDNYAEADLIENHQLLLDNEKSTPQYCFYSQVHPLLRLLSIQPEPILMQPLEIPFLAIVHLNIPAAVTPLLAFCLLQSSDGLDIEKVSVCGREKIEDVSE